MLNVKAKGRLVPTRLVALRLVVTCPLAVGVPVIAPVLVLSDSPAGKLLGATTAYAVTGAWLATIW